MKATLFVLLQYCVPQHLFSRIAGYVARSKIPWFKNWLIKRFIAHFGVNMSEAAEADPEQYPHFNAFFTRALAEGAREFPSDPRHFLSPADGAISQLGAIQDHRIFQAKGRFYRCEELLGDAEKAKAFRQGEFATIYLSPKDYHRLHMPLAGRLTGMTHIPGKLFSVNPTTADSVDRLFARNERLVCYFDTENGPMALVLVGAMIVASIETTWAGVVAPSGIQPTHTDYPGPTIEFEKGEEFARFLLGSTVIVLMPSGTLRWQEGLNAEAEVKVGEVIAKLLQGEVD